MNWPRLISDPLTRKRIRRFREKKRAWWSLWILVGLYAVSLGSELLCNDRPLYARFRGRSYFPTFRFYPEDTFRENGRKTRPDYLALRGDPVFRGDPANFMLFPPVACGPDTNIDPASLRAGERVTLTLKPVPRIGSLNVRDDMTIERSQACGSFFGVDDRAVAGLALTNYWAVPEALESAMRARLRNAACPAATFRLASLRAPQEFVEASLTGFEPRASPPPSVRLTLREPDAPAGTAASLTFSVDLKPLSPPPPLWSTLSASDRSQLVSLVRQAFTAPVYPEPVTRGSTQYRVTIEKNDIRWPHPPVKGHWMGIDSAGRDVLARILYGLRISMTFGFILVLFSMAIGVAIGAVQGYYGGWVDISGQRMIEIWSALPFLYVMILLGSVYGSSFTLLLICYGLFKWIGISYYMRAEFLRLRHLPFVDSAKSMGIPTRWVIVRHILPNALTPVITFFPFSLVGAIGALAALDYLGFGLPPPAASWGQLLQQAQQFRWAWWLILYPSLALFVVMLLGVFVGEGVRDAYDPRRFSRLE